MQVVTFSGINAVADARAGDDDVGRALGGGAGVGSGDDAVWHGNVGSVDGVAGGVEFLLLCPLRNGLRAPRYQCQTVVGLIKAPGQRLPDAAGCACDKKQGQQGRLRLGAGAARWGGGRCCKSHNWGRGTGRW